MQTKWKKGDYSIVPNKEAIRGLPAPTRSVYLAVCDRADEDGVCWPSFKTLAKDAGVSKPTAITHIEKLVELGFLLCEKRHKKGKKESDSNVYTVLLKEGEGGKGGLPPVVKEFNHPSKGVLPGVVKEVDRNYNHITIHKEDTSVSNETQSHPSSLSGGKEKEKKGSAQRKEKDNGLNPAFAKYRPLVIKEFEAIDPVNAPRWYANVTELKAIDQLLAYIVKSNKQPESLVAAVKFLKETNTEPFAPTAYKPSEWLRKFVKWLDFMKERERKKKEVERKEVVY